MTNMEMRNERTALEEAQPTLPECDAAPVETEESTYNVGEIHPVRREAMSLRYKS